MSERSFVSRARCSAKRSGAVRRRTGTHDAGAHTVASRGPRISAAPARKGAPLQRIRGTSQKMDAAP
jgi:hypothetical protein